MVLISGLVGLCWLSILRLLMLTLVALRWLGLACCELVFVAFGWVCCIMLLPICGYFVCV